MRLVGLEPTLLKGSSHARALFYKAFRVSSLYLKDANLPLFSPKVAQKWHTVFISRHKKNTSPAVWGGMNDSLSFSGIDMCVSMEVNTLCRTSQKDCRSIVSVQDVKPRRIIDRSGHRDACSLLEGLTDIDGLVAVVAIDLDQLAVLVFVSQLSHYSLEGLDASSCALVRNENFHRNLDCVRIGSRSWSWLRMVGQVLVEIDCRADSVNASLLGILPDAAVGRLT